MTPGPPDGPNEFRGAFEWLRARLIARIEPRESKAASPFAAPAPLADLAKCFSLDIFEQQLILLCLMIEFNPRLGEAYALAQGDGNRPFPTLALARGLLDQPRFTALAADATLRRYRLVELDRDEFGELATRRIRLAQRMLHLLSGETPRQPDLLQLLTPLHALDIHAADDATLDPVRAAFAGTPPQIVRLLGRDGNLKRCITQRVAAEAGLAALHLVVEDLPEAHFEVTELAHLLAREARLSPFCIFVSSRQDGNATPEQMMAACRVVERLPIPTVIDLDGVGLAGARATIHLDLPATTYAGRRASWIEALGADAEEHAWRLASTFETTSSEIAAIGAALGTAGREQKFRAAWEACRRLSRPVLDTLARRVTSRATLDDVVLPARTKSQLVELTDQVRLNWMVTEDWGFAEKSRRGLGLSALFAGESGTGKTFAAEAIANELDYDLYRVDLSAVVSKFIGETEKNLKRVFDAAERGGAILFFDESDALFGRRTEVKDSHDRYANIEINYLLQRMEDYRGMSILATNRRSALDQAFTRRLAFVVEFPFPGPEQAQEIWASAFPAAAPTGALDFARLAALNLTGGSIRNVALRAAYRAARSGVSIDTDLVLEAARSEQRKIGKPLADD
jgi:predicted nucleic acid-binding protein